MRRIAINRPPHQEPDAPMGCVRELLAGDGPHARARRLMCAAWRHMPQTQSVRDRNRAWSRLSGVELRMVIVLADSLTRTGICTTGRGVRKKIEFVVHHEAEQYITALLVRPIVGPPKRREPPKAPNAH